MQIKSYQNYCKIALKSNLRQEPQSNYQPMIYRQSYTFPWGRVLWINSPIYDKIHEQYILSKQSNVQVLFSQKQVQLVKCAVDRIIKIFFCNQLTPSEKAEELQLVTKMSSVYLNYKLQRKFNANYDSPITDKQLLIDWNLEMSDEILTSSNSCDIENESNDTKTVKLTLTHAKGQEIITVNLRNMFGNYLIDGIDMPRLKLSGYTRSA